jgi:hypothetical protein
MVGPILLPVIPAEAGIHMLDTIGSAQTFQYMDPRLRGDDA